MSMPKIRELHASFIWTESAKRLPENKAPMGYLGNPKRFVNYFANLSIQRELATNMLASDDQDALANILEISAPNSDPLRSLHWALPWEVGKHYYEHHFWHYYLGGADLREAVSGKVAWEHLVPLRLGLPLRIAGPRLEADEPTVRIFADGYAYPHGSAVEIKLQLDYDGEGVDAQDALHHLLDHINDNGVSVSLPGGTSGHFSLPKLAERLLKFLHDLVRGKNALRDVSPDGPLWVVTVVKGTIGSMAIPLGRDIDLHRVLDGFCTLARDWPTCEIKKLAPLDKANLLIGSSNLGHLGGLPNISGLTDGNFIYHNPRSPRGRLVWMHQYFTSNDRHIFKLSCYHRNLVLLSLQTEMLVKALFLFASHPQKPAFPEQLARAVAQRLTELYGSEKEHTYLSASPRTYLDESKYTEKINDILLGLKLPHLQWTPWGNAEAEITTPPPGQ